MGSFRFPLGLVTQKIPKVPCDVLSSFTRSEPTNRKGRLFPLSLVRRRSQVSDGRLRRKKATDPLRNKPLHLEYESGEG